MIHIYGLVDPRTKEIRYIGKSMRVKARFRDHLKDPAKTHKANWIKSLKKLNLIPTLVILEEIADNEDWISREIFWIKTAREKGWNLVNSTDGGDGVLNVSGEGKQRMLATWKGRKHKPETLIKLSKASKGRIKTAEQKSFMREKMVGRKITWTDKLQVALRKFDNSNIPLVLKDLQTMKVIDVAKKYGVHRTTITKIKLGTYHTFKQKTKNKKKQGQLL